MVHSAAKGAAQVKTTRVAGMREEANPAVAAMYRTACQTGTIAQDGVERELILPNKRKGAVVLVPIVAK
jgi:hypothetical protein